MTSPGEGLREDVHEGLHMVRYGCPLDREFPKQ